MSGVVIGELVLGLSTLIGFVAVFVKIGNWKGITDEKIKNLENGDNKTEKKLDKLDESIQKLVNSVTRIEAQMTNK